MEACNGGTLKVQINGSGHHDVIRAAFERFASARERIPSTSEIWDKVSSRGFSRSFLTPHKCDPPAPWNLQVAARLWLSLFGAFWGPSAAFASGFCILSQPQEYSDLKHDQTRREFVVMSLSFPEKETNVLYVGTEAPYARRTLSVRKSASLSVTMATTLPVTGIEAATVLALVSSFDWSIKLGMVKQYQSLVLSMDKQRPESQRGNVQFCKCRQLRAGYKSWAPQMGADPRTVHALRYKLTAKDLVISKAEMCHSKHEIELSCCSEPQFCSCTRLWRNVRPF